MTSLNNQKQSTTRILIHCQDGAGLEGAECTLAMTTHWARLYANCSFLVLTDLSTFNSLELPPHVDYIHIPSDKTETETGTLRQTVLMTTLAHFDPHMLIVHYSPTAVMNGAHDVAHYTRQNHPTIKIVLGLWNPGVPNSPPAPNWIEPQLSQQLQSLYDQIWLYTPEPIFEKVNGNGHSTILTQMINPSKNGNGHHH
ncbi:MAG: hypothetical protein AAF614_25935 [Chloroflexota bacterium]